MRGLWKLAATALAALSLTTLLARTATRHGEQTPAFEPREARAEDLARDVVPPVRFALANSLWGETAIGPCLVGAFWGTGLEATEVRAQFAPMMRLSMRTPLKSPARMGVWVTREVLDTAPANDADVASRYVAMEPGAAPVVRVLRVARFARSGRERAEFARALKAA